jgi:hypothetical protein
MKAESVERSASRPLISVAMRNRPSRTPPSPARSPPVCERVCCLLVLNSVTSIPQWIRQSEVAWLCVWCLCVWCLCVSMCSDILGSLSL